MIRNEKAKKVSLFSKPKWVTRSALEKYLINKPSSRKPKTIFTLFIQLPDLGRVCSQLGKSANKAKGSPKARPNPASTTVNWTGPPLGPRALTTKVPRMGPVQEKETNARARAIKKIHPTLLRLDLL